MEASLNRTLPLDPNYSLITLRIHFLPGRHQAENFLRQLTRPNIAMTVQNLSFDPGDVNLGFTGFRRADPHGNSKLGTRSYDEM